MKKYFAAVILFSVFMIHFNTSAAVITGNQFEVPIDVTDELITEYLKSEINLLNKIGDTKEFVLPDQTINELGMLIEQNQLYFLVGNLFSKFI